MVNRGVGRVIIWADKRSPISGEGGEKEEDEALRSEGGVTSLGEGPFLRPPL